MAEQSFHRRYGFAPQKEIVIREAAPEHIRKAILQIALRDGLMHSELRDLVCQMLRRSPDRKNYTDNDLATEAYQDIRDCPWYLVYALVERIADEFKRIQRTHNHGHVGLDFERDINELFIDEGVGWQLVNGEIVTRGDQAFERNVQSVTAELIEAGRPTAATRIQEALHDLSRRPQADLFGAVGHAVAAVECLLGDATGENKATFGDFLKRYPFEPSLRKGMEGLWGYACNEGARHGKEGVEPGREEAEFIVTICAGLVRLLNAGHSRN